MKLLPLFMLSVSVFASDTVLTVLHTVHGAFEFVDARSGESGNGSRDQRMHKSIIESAKFTEILFTPDHVEGRVPDSGTGLLKIHGDFTMHGGRHEVTMPISVKVESGQIIVSSSFKIPYVSWGLKNPSTFLLRVDDNVDITSQSVGRISH